MDFVTLKSKKEKKLQQPHIEISFVVPCFSKDSSQGGEKVFRQTDCLSSVD